jgi:hypothetical protein
MAGNNAVQMTPSQSGRIINLGINKIPQKGLLNGEKYQLSSEEKELKDTINAFERDLNLKGDLCLVVPMKEFKHNSFFFETALRYKLQFNVISMVAREVPDYAVLLASTNERRKVAKIIAEKGVKEAEKVLRLLQKKRDEKHDVFGKILDNLIEPILVFLKLSEPRDIDWAIEVYKEEINFHINLSQLQKVK